MRDDEHPILRDRHIELKNVHSLSYGVFERRDCVFRTPCPGAAMALDLNPVARFRRKQGHSGNQYQPNRKSHIGPSIAQVFYSKVTNRCRHCH
jgi:hypothetical protein